MSEGLSVTYRRSLSSSTNDTDLPAKIKLLLNEALNTQNLPINQISLSYFFNLIIVQCLFCFKYMVGAIYVGT
jgi:hypothetical protein